MASDPGLDIVRKQIVQLEEEVARVIREFKEIVERASGQGQAGGPPKSQFLRIAEFLLSRNNQPTTAKAILLGSGVKRASLSQILHRSHKDSFISVPIPGFSRIKKWALTEAAAAQGELVLVCPK